MSEEAGFLAAIGAPQTYAAEDKPLRVPDLRCLKCGSDDVLLRWYQSGHDLQLTDRRCGAYGGLGEHFHRECRRCGYGWVTTDMLDAEEATK